MANKMMMMMMMNLACKSRSIVKSYTRHVSSLSVQLLRPHGQQTQNHQPLSNLNTDSCPLHHFTEVTAKKKQQKSSCPQSDHFNVPVLLNNITVETVALNCPISTRTVAVALLLRTENVWFYWPTLYCTRTRDWLVHLLHLFTVYDIATHFWKLGRRPSLGNASKRPTR